MVSLSNFSFLHNKDLFSKKFILFFIVSVIMFTIILDSNFLMGFLKEKILSMNYKIIIFSLYVSIFLISVFILLNRTYQTIHKKEDKITNAKIYFICMFLIYSILAVTLVSTTIQILFLKSYSNIVFYITSYLSFISSLIFLSILSFKFFQWYIRGKNNFTLFYGILFSLYCMSLLLALLYLISGLATHPSIINYTSPRELRAGTYSINIDFQNHVAIIYDVLFFVSFLLAWILTVLMLKQYSRRFGKYKFWILVSLPLVFYLLRYEGIILSYFNFNDFFSLSNLGTIYPNIGAAIYAAFINSNIQATGIFFGLSFLAILLKLKNSQLQNDMIITIIGMMILFASRDFHAIFLNSVPPNGVVTISFMGIGSFVLFFGIISFLRQAVRDKEFYADLITRIESDIELLKNIIVSEKEIELSKKIKPLLDYSHQWQKEHKYDSMKNEEIKQIIDDVLSEFRKGKRSIV
jgi:MFS family permease